MDTNVNPKRNINSTTAIDILVSYIKGNFEVKNEDKYNESEAVRLIAFEHEDLTYIMDIYNKKPNHLRLYILFDEPSEIETINTANKLSRFAKGTNINQDSGEKLCIEIEQMMFGVQTRATAEKYILFCIEYINKYLSILVEEESRNEQEGD